MSGFESAVLIIMGTFAAVMLGAVIYDYIGRKAEKKSKSK